jgi:REP element-mobilizing transposase RayT
MPANINSTFKASDKLVFKTIKPPIQNNGKKEHILFPGSKKYYILAFNFSKPFMSQDYNPKIQNRRSNRLRGFDYSNSGAYFVTICTKNREQVFGEIKDGEMHLNELGCIARDEWIASREIRETIELGEFIVMPDHLHGIVIIKPKPKTAKESEFLLPSFRSPSYNLGSMIRGYKGAVTRKINEYRNTPRQAVWQRNYHDRIIRTVDESLAIINYIQSNPVNWTNI